MFVKKTQKDETVKFYESIYDPDDDETCEKWEHAASAILAYKECLKKNDAEWLKHCKSKGFSIEDGAYDMAYQIALINGQAFGREVEDN